MRPTSERATRSRSPTRPPRGAGAGSGTGAAGAAPPPPPPPPAEGWRAFVHGVVAELGRDGFPLVGARLQISGGLPFGAGLSSSAALEIALCLALVDLGSRAVS